MYTILRYVPPQDLPNTPSKPACFQGKVTAKCAANLKKGGVNHFKTFVMSKFYSMENLIKGGYCSFPRAVIENLDHPEKQIRTIARALFIFFRDAYFKQGIVVIKESAYPCMRGQLITNHKELTIELKINTRDWERYFKDLKEENVIQVERLRYGTRITLIAYDKLIGAKLREVSAPKMPKKDDDVANINMEEMFPEDDNK